MGLAETCRRTLNQPNLKPDFLHLRRRALDPDALSKVDECNWRVAGSGDDHPPVIDPRHASRPIGQKWLLARKLRFCKPEVVTRHGKPPNVWDF
jgi:hypothetical protein